MVVIQPDGVLPSALAKFIASGKAGQENQHRKFLKITEIIESHTDL